MRSDWGAPLRRHPGGAAIEAALRAALAAVDPAAAVARALQGHGSHLRVAGEALGDGRIEVLALGKAAVAMSRPVLQALQGRPQVHATVVTKVVAATPIEAEVYVGGHPIPTGASVVAAEALLRRATPLGADDTAIVLLSGGASALACAPAPGVTLQQIQDTTATMLREGADIEQLNIVRRRLDRLKGGGLLSALAPARVITLVLSDVVGDDLATVGSGPTVSPDGGETTAVHHIVANNATAVEAAAASLAGAGWPVSSLRPSLRGDAVAAGRALATRPEAGRAVPGWTLVAGGETVVHVTGDGRGGRNQHLALAAAIALEGGPPATLVTFATDGEDGPTDAAGAVVTETTSARARAAGVDPVAALRRCDAYAVFEATGDLLRPGSTGTNVCDLAIAVYDPPTSSP